MINYTLVHRGNFQLAPEAQRGKLWQAGVAISDAGTMLNEKSDMLQKLYDSLLIWYTFSIIPPSKIDLRDRNYTVTIVNFKDKQCMKVITCTILISKNEDETTEC